MSRQNQTQYQMQQDMLSFNSSQTNLRNSMKVKPVKQSYDSLYEPKTATFSKAFESSPGMKHQIQYPSRWIAKSEKNSSYKKQNSESKRVFSAETTQNTLSQNFNGQQDQSQTFETAKNVKRILNITEDSNQKMSEPNILSEQSFGKNAEQIEQQSEQIDDLNDVMNIINNFEHCLLTYVNIGSSDIDIRRLIEDELTSNIIAKFNEIKEPGINLSLELQSIGKTISNLQNINDILMQNQLVVAQANRQICEIAKCVDSLNSNANSINGKVKKQSVQKKDNINKIYESLKIENQQNKKEINDKKIEIQKLREENEKMKKREETYNLENQLVQVKNDELQEKNNELLEKNEELQEKYDELQEINDEKIKNLQDIDPLLQENFNILLRLCQRFLVSMKELHKTVIKIPKDEDQINLKKHYFENDKSSLDEFIEKIKSGKQQFTPNQDSFTPKISLVHVQSPQSPQTPQTPNLDLKELKEENDRLKSELKNLYSNISDYKVQHDELKKSVKSSHYDGFYVNQLKQENIDLKNKLSKLESETDKIIQDSSRINVNKYTGQSLIQKVNILLEEKDQEIKFLQMKNKEIYILEDQLLRSNDSYHDLEQKYYTLQQEFSQVCQELNEVENFIDQKRKYN